MFSLFRKKFDVEKHLEIKAYHAATHVPEPVEGRSYRLVTEGLARWDRRELEVLDVPWSAFTAASWVLQQVAAYTVNEKRIQDRQTFAGSAGPFASAVRCFETVSHGLEVSRLGDVGATDCPTGPPQVAMATFELVLALATYDEDPEAAVGTWLASIERFPGTPDGGPERRVTGLGYNTENFLTYLALAKHDSERRERWLEAAFERSSIAVEHELGVEVLPELPLDQLRRDAAQLVIAVQTGPGGEPWGPQRMRADGKRGADMMALLLSPLMARRGDRVVRIVNPVPFTFRNYFYEAPVRDLLRSDAVLGVVAEVYAARRAAPAKLLAQTCMARSIYQVDLEPTAFGLTDQPEEMAIDVEETVPPHFPALSRIAADVGRRVAAGLAIDELRASYGLSTDAAAQERARTKLADLDALEGKHYGAAVGVDWGLADAAR